MSTPTQTPEQEQARKSHSVLIFNCIACGTNYERFPPPDSPRYPDHCEVCRQPLPERRGLTRRPGIKVRTPEMIKGLDRARG